MLFDGFGATATPCGYGSLRSQGRREQVSRWQGRNPVAPKKKKRLAEQRDATCPDLVAKIFLFSPHPNHRHIYRRLVPSRGAARDRHGRWERDAVDAIGALDEAH